MAQIDDGLSTQQAVALISETTSARSILGYGLWALRNAEFMETTLDPIMTMLSIGLEKMMKMALGLISVADTGAWPPYSKFKNGWRHDLTLMNSELLAELRTRLPLSTRQHLVEPSLLAVENDAALGPIVAALTRFGFEGRFYYLDQLAEHPQADERADALWEAAEREMMASDPVLQAQYHAAVNGPVPESYAFFHGLEARMAQTIEDYWKLLCLAGTHRMLGARGVGWGGDAHPDMVGRQVRPQP